MPDTAAPSQQLSGPQQGVLAYIESRDKENTKRGIRNALHTVAGTAIYIGASLLFPPAGIAGAIGIAGLLYGSIFGWDLIKDVGTEFSLRTAKKEVVDDPTFEKTAARAAKNEKRYGLFSNIMLGAVLVAAAAAVTILVAPAAAAVAGPVFGLGIWTGLAAGAEKLHLGAYKAADGAAKEGQIAVKVERVRALENEAANLKSTLNNAPSPGPSFDKAANNNTPAPDAPAADPVLKKDVPKP